MKHKDRPVLVQAALDMPDLNRILQLSDSLAAHADVLEIGSAPIMKYGMQPVTDIRKWHPDAVILADVKIMDAGTRSATVCFEAGADIVTVLANASDATIREVVQTARAFGRQVMIDLIQVQDLVDRARQLDGFGADWMCVHAAKDLQGSPETAGQVFEELETLQRVLEQTGTAIAGGIGFDSAQRLARLQPDVVIAGKVLADADDPGKAAQRLKEILAAPDLTGGQDDSRQD